MRARHSPRRATIDGAMTVTRRDILLRGLLHRCPNCGGKTVFRGLFKTNERCERCGFLIEREDGFFLGAMAINYGVTALPMVPIFVLVFLDAISVPLAMAIVAAWALVVPVVFYRSSKSLWMMLVYLFTPRDLPANKADAQRALPPSWR